MVQIFLVLMMSCLGFADWSDTPSKSFELGPPPEAGSVQEKEEIQQMIDLQKGDRKAQCELAKNQLHPTYASFYKDTNLLTADEYKKLEPIMERVFKFSVRVANYHKNKFKRTRPYNVDNRVKPCVVKPSGNKSYPSSHATAAWTSACVLAYAYLPRSRSFLEYGNALGDLRSVVGVHFPSDVEAGRALGTSICIKLLQDNEFTGQVRDARIALLEGNL